MDNVWEIVSGAPWWVYVLFIYLASIGLQSAKPRTVSVKRMVLFPLFFVAWSAYGLYQNASLGFYSLIFWWVIFLGLGSYLGAKLVHSWKIHKDYHRGVITIPGNYSTLILILLIFILKFIWGVFYATLSPVPYLVYVADATTSSLVTGFFVGRVAFFLRSYIRGT